MLDALRIYGRTIALWWQQIFVLTFANLLWLLCQASLIAGPPATAAMYIIARQVIDGEEPTFGGAWRALRATFLPAWKWGLLNLAIAATVAGNFWLYQRAAGPTWIALRLLWATIGLGWLALNLVYWPFWLAQADRSLTATLRNCFVFYARRPTFALTLFFLSLALAVGGTLLTLPLGTLLMSWLALAASLAVERELQRADHTTVTQPADPRR